MSRAPCTGALADGAHQVSETKAPGRRGSVRAKSVVVFRPKVSTLKSRDGR